VLLELRFSGEKRRPTEVRVRNRDPLGHYQALNVSPDAGSEEIVLAYRLLKQAYHERRDRLDIGRIQKAYQTLMDAERRARYDEMGRQRRGSLRAGVGTPGMLVCLVAILAVSLGVTLGPSLRYALVSFDPGDELYWNDGEGFLGTVQRYEPQHRFENGSAASAYLLETPTGDQVWYPARDLARLTEVN
jgi:curved DNA-binding protein CbpA